MFDLTIHWRENSDIHAIASALDALIAAVDNIEAHYKLIYAEAEANLTPSAKHDPLPKKAREYPFITSYEEDGKRVTFAYNSRLHGQKLVFFVTPDQPGAAEFVVKFTQRYSQAAHSCLASVGSAPRLRGCFRITGDWTAVIMDKSEYQERVRHKMMRVVQMLHQLGFVHGDIRDTNILIDVGSFSSEDVAIHLVDLDWAGRIGGARYPIGINESTVTRPAGVESGGLITAKHDLEMVSFLFASA